MEYETCPTCGHKLRYDDVTDECELKWEHGTENKYLVHIIHQGEPIIYLGPGCTSHPPLNKDYRIEDVYKTADGSGWWFRVLKLRR